MFYWDRDKNRIKDKRSICSEIHFQLQEYDNRHEQHDNDNDNDDNYDDDNDNDHHHEIMPSSPCIRTKEEDRFEKKRPKQEVILCNLYDLIIALNNNKSSSLLGIHHSARQQRKDKDNRRNKDKTNKCYWRRSLVVDKQHENKNKKHKYKYKYETPPSLRSSKKKSNNNNNNNNKMISTASTITTTSKLTECSNILLHHFTENDANSCLKDLLQMQQMQQMQRRGNYPSLHFSRLGEDLRGSTRILCFQYKVAFFLIWNVVQHHAKSDCQNFDVQVVPVVNSSPTLSDLSLQVVSRNTTKALCTQFEKELQRKKQLDSTRSTPPHEEKEDHIFCSLSKFLLSREADILEMISNELSILCQPDERHLVPLERMFKKSHINIERSLDYFDFFALKNEDDGTSWLTNSETGNSATPPENDDVCPICFETFDGDAVYLRTCGHKACISCWRTLVRVSSTSGDISIRCPGLGCNATLNSRDTAHILFDNAEDPNDDCFLADIKVLMKLETYKLNQMLLDRKAKHCSTPSCKSIFLNNTDSTTSIYDIRSKSVCICQCGHSLCVQCGEPSHFGISCATQKKIKKEIVTGRVQAELKSLLWLQKNTSPCPKCKFPINKQGGCNHMRCSKCQYYFCWLCGGDGNQCGSYRCKKTGKVTFQNEINEPTYLDDMKNLNPIASIMNYSDAVVNLEKLFERNDLNNSKSVRELQLRKMLVWTSSVLLSRSLSAVGRRNNGNNISKTRDALELTLSNLLDNPTDDEIESIMKDEKAITYPLKHHYSKKKTVSKTSQKQTERQHEHYEKTSSLRDILEITKLRSMNNKRFNAHVSSLLHNTMDQLVSAKQGRKKTVNKTESVPCSLNKKLKPLKAPWKGECRFDPPKIIVVETKKYSPRAKIEEKLRKPWKGRFRVNTRREIALSLREV